ncbi:S8 family serine peptidase [Streptomyces antarcticus]|uniref:S8 family serine peptidase n=1 Tax=Streptomyces antarcticus TaxID=2996458 RepID=UPI00226FDAF4|nr:MULTISPECIES: S8 family serine peptidase [unclassified Streptomyces]MCY0943678.1 S8 family serine peptidase [Streptomyces sp. H34-AA3]MCZ4084241.1 S8 family serine peptidase [Streptomyces sp. H34-S5]
MTLESPSSISGPRRAARIAAAAGLVAALCATGAMPAFAAGTVDGPRATPPVKSADQKLGSADAELLQEAKSKGDKTVTVMVATAPGETKQVAQQLGAVEGASVGRTYDDLGYVRATLPTGKADAALKAAVKLNSVHGIDLRHEIQLPDPRPDADREGAAAKKTAAETYPAPDANTPAKNPYNPSFETGAVDFVTKNPQADGRGVTIGIMDSGVDLGHPALQTTTTGERKIVDWVTATDPITDNDGTWRAQITPVAGASFAAGGSTWKAPEGAFQWSRFTESITANGDMAGDVNRDGDTTDRFGMLYDPATGTVRVDTDQDLDFTNNEPMKPYKDGYQVGYFGTDNPATPVVERIPFVIEIRKDVPMDPLGGDWVGKKADFVNIGIIEGTHGTHVAGITAANSLFGGKMNGAAPGAKLVSSRACTWSGGCTNIALTEGMIDLVVNRGVDIVNMSIGGLPALNDGNNARSELYSNLIDKYGVQLVISAGNEGPGVNTIGDPALADKVLSVGAAVSKETWAANYGSGVAKKYNMFNFSSRGPREDGGFTPTISAPGASINTAQTWIPGSPVKEAGYALPPGYAMLQGTSMSSPQAAGASALLISAAKQANVALKPAGLRVALTSTAKKIADVPAHAQGAGLIDVVGAWESIQRDAKANEFTVKAPVDTAIDQFLKTPGFGTGVYDREGGLKVGQKKVYNVVVTRTTGVKYGTRHDLSWRNNDGTFKVIGGYDYVTLPLNKPVTIKVEAKATSAGVHSGILQLDDATTEGIDKQILTTVVASTPLATPTFKLSDTSSVQRNSHKSYFVTVPPGAKTLEVALGGLQPGSQTRFISIHPYGLGVEDSATTQCYPNYDNPANACRPDLRSYADPQPGVWEIEVESRRTSPLLDNPYKLDVSVLGAAFDPAVKVLPEVKLGTPAPVQWTVKNEAAAIAGGKLKGGPLGSAKVAKPTIATGETHTTEVTIGAGVSRLDIAIGKTSDTGADLDLDVYKDGVKVGSSADGDSEEAVSLVNPAAGTYTIEVLGYAIPSGSTTYDYRDVFFSAALGSVQVDEAAAVNLASGATAQVSANVLVSSAAPEGRQFFGQVQLLNAGGTAAGTGSVQIEKVLP